MLEKTLSSLDFLKGENLFWSFLDSSSYELSFVAVVSALHQVWIFYYGEKCLFSIRWEAEPLFDALIVLTSIETSLVSSGLSLSSLVICLSLIYSGFLLVSLLHIPFFLSWGLFINDCNIYSLGDNLRDDPYCLFLSRFKAYNVLSILPSKSILSSLWVHCSLINLAFSSISLGS